MAIIITGNGNDTVNGTSGADQILSSGGNDLINAGNGNDIVLAGSGNDTVDGGAGEDFIEGGDGNDRLFGGTGSDIVLTGKGLDLAFGGGGADLLDARLSGGGLANDVTLVGDGFDSSAAYAANGSRTTQVGNDILFGGDGNDTLYGDNAHSSTASSGGDDALTGGGGNDSLYGEGGNDILLGDAGNDTLVGGRGADRLSGGSGNDIFVFDASTAGSDSTSSALDIICDFTRGSDRIDLRSLLGATDLFWGDKAARANGVWYSHQGNDTFVYADINGDKVADLTLRLDGKHTLAVSDFLGVISGLVPVADTASVTEGGAAINGNVLTNDSPAGVTVSGVKSGSTNGTVGQDLAGIYGTLRLNSNGTYTYTLSNNVAVNALAAGQVVNEVFTYVASAGSNSASSTLTIAITGINDAASISGANTGSVQEDGTLSAGGTLTVNDADAGQALLQAATVAKTYGTFVVAANGSWTYVLNNAAGNVQALQGGQIVQDTLVVTSVDGTGTRTLTVGITGKNDAPVAVNDAASMQEDGAPILISVLANDADLDGGTILSIKAGSLSVVGGSATGTAQIVGNQIQFTPAPNFNGTAVVNYQVTDGALSSTASVTISINAVNDAAVITGTASGAVTEDAVVSSVSGTLQVADIDGPAQDTFVAQTGTAGVYGTFSIDAAGHWSYNLDNGKLATQALNGEDSPVDSFTVQSLDGTPKIVQITINGATDVSGRVTDGPVAGAQVYLDNDGNGEVSSGDLHVATTDSEGNFSFNTALNVGGWQLLATGGTDTVTGEANSLVLSAPAGYSYINPLTTLVQAIAEESGGGAAAVAAAQASVLAAFGLNPVLELAVTDIYASNLAAQQAAAIVATAAIIVQEEGGNADPFAALAAQVVTGGAGGGLEAVEEVVSVEAPDALESFQYTAEAIGNATSTGDIGTALNQGYFNDAAPVAVNDTASTAEDVAVLMDVLANDTDADNIAPTAANAGLTIKAGSVSVVEGPAAGTAQIVGNQIQFTPAADFNGTATISYVTTDGTLDSAQAAVTVNVTPVNDAPTQDGTGEAPGSPSGILKFYNGVVVASVVPGPDQAFGLATQPDGKFLTVGFAGQYSATTDNDFALVRYNADGSLDSSFGAGGKALLQFPGVGNDQGRAVAVQGDGKIVVVGIVSFTSTVGTGADIALARYNPDGTLDTTFNAAGSMPGTVVRSIGSGGTADGLNSVVVLADGKILASGFAVIDGSTTNDFLLVRYNADGTPDATFGSNGVITTPIDGNSGQDVSQSLALTSDGKIVLAGWTYAVNGATTPTDTRTNDIAVVRYNADGTLDTSFSDDGKATFSVSSLTGSNQLENGRSVKVLSDGKILVGGWTTGTGQDFMLMRINADGTLDTEGLGSGAGHVTTTIGTSSLPNDQAQMVLVQPDGKIVLVGSANNSSGTTGQDIALVRYNANGTLDTTFGNGGKTTVAIGPGGTGEAGFSAALLPDGKILVTGVTGLTFSSLRSSTFVARFNADGSLDTSFSTGFVVQGGAQFGFSIPADWFGDPEGGTLTYSIAPVNGTAVPAWLGFDPLTNRFSGTPPQGAADAELLLIATDSGGLTASQLLTIQVNDPPTIPVQPTLMTNEDSPASATAAVIDPDGDTLGSFTIGTQATHGNATLNSSNGLYTYTPLANYFGPDSFVIRTTDPYGAINAVTVSVSVNPVHDTPVAVNDAASTTEDIPVTIDVLANDTDADNLSPTPANAGLSIKEGSVSVVGGAATGTAQIVGNQIQFTPAANFSGSATINYVATDGTLDSAQAAVTVNVTPVNDAPTAIGHGGPPATANSGILNVIHGVVTTAVVNGAFADQIVSMVVQPDGKLLVAGTAAGMGRGPDFAIVRYNADGSLDVSFGTGGKVVLPISAGSGADNARGIALQADGRIVVAGLATNTTTGQDLALVRLNANGSLDNAFGSAGVVTQAIGPGSVNDAALSVAIQPDGRIVTAGYTGNPTDVLLARYMPDGSPDGSFEADGVVTTNIDAGGGAEVAQGLALQSDGKIIVAGFTYAANAAAGSRTNDIALVRYNSDASLDGSFGANGRATASLSGVFDNANSENGRSVAVLPNGKILVGGWAITGTAQDFALLRFNADGSLDDTFGQLVGAGPVRTGYVTTNIGTSGTPNDQAHSLLLQSDGKIVLVGFAMNSGGTTGQDIALVRYNTDGTLDTSFGGGDGIVTTAIGPGVTPDQGFSAVLLPGDQIVVGGFTGNISTDFALARFTADGALDPTFNANVTVQRGAAMGYTLPTGWFADPDAGDTLAYGVAMADGSALPSWLVFDAATGRISGIPGATDQDAVLRVTAADGGGLTASQVVTIKINDGPQAAASVAFSTNEDTTLSNTLVTQDPEGDIVLTFTMVTAPAHGNLSLNSGGSFNYTPHYNYSGTDSFVYRSTDPYGASSINATVNITINPVNDAPEYIRWSNAFTGPADVLPGAGATIGTMSAFDPEGNTPISWSHAFGAVTITQGGVLTITEALVAGTSPGADVIVIDSLGNAREVSVDFRVGLSGGQHMLGGGGEDVMFGLGGNDNLEGRGGNDLLYGGSGGDNFVMTNGGGLDTVMDFEPGIDEVDLRNFTNPDLNSFAEIQARLSQTAQGAMLDLGNGNAILLVGVTASLLTADDFQY